MNPFTATIATAAISLGGIAGCQPPPSDVFQPGIPVVEQSPIPVWDGQSAHADTPAVRITCKVQAREGAPVPNVEPGCQLNIQLSHSTIGGRTPEQRCDDLGGKLRYSNILLCVGVDY